jgi:hypothetical protein
LRRSHCGLSVSGAVPFGPALSQKSIAKVCAIIIAATGGIPLTGFPRKFPS